MPENSKNISVKSCEIMQYFKYMDCNEIAVIISRIKTLTNLKSWSIILHDKDVLPSGQSKPPHFHCVLTFSNAKTIKSIADCIGVEMQYVEKIRTTTKSARLYHIHRNNPEKYQYPPEDVQASFDYISYVDDCPIKQKRESIAERIDSGEIKQYNLFKFVSIDEYSRNKRYYQSCFEYRLNKLKGLDRNMECIFITGGSGTGKSTYAKMIASQKGYATYISSGGKNPLDNYQGEECIILDDTRSSTWNLTDFLKLTDNHTDSLVGCRYYNKSIAECKLLIVTSVKSIDEFYENATKEDNEPKIQLLRRFNTLIDMTVNTNTFYCYSDEKKRHIKAFSYQNPVSALFQPQIAKKLAEDFIKLMNIEVIEDDQPSLIPIDDKDLPF